MHQKKISLYLKDYMNKVNNVIPEKNEVDENQDQ